MESTGEIRQLEARKGKDGKTRTAKPKRPKKKQNGTPALFAQDNGHRRLTGFQ